MPGVRLRVDLEIEPGPAGTAQVQVLWPLHGTYPPCLDHQGAHPDTVTQPRLRAVDAVEQLPEVLRDMTPLPGAQIGDRRLCKATFQEG